MELKDVSSLIVEDVGFEQGGYVPIPVLLVWVLPDKLGRWNFGIRRMKPFMADENPRFTFGLVYLCIGDDLERVTTKH